MTATLDYAQLFETEFRPRGSLGRRLRRLAARVLLAGLFVVHPRLAVAIWRENR